MTTSAGNLTPASPGNVRGPGSFDLKDPSVGLTVLSGYQQSLKITFNGQRGGKASQFTTAYSQAIVRQPMAELTTVDISDQGVASHYLFADLGLEKATQPGADQPCQVNWGDAAANGASPFQPASMLPPIAGAEAAGDETVGGVPAMAYKFDQRALGRVGSSQAVGEVWIAKQGAWVVKYSLTLKGQDDVFGQGSSGEQDWEYAVTDVGTVTSIQLPAACPAVLTDIPMLDDAKNVIRQPDFIGYATSARVEAAVSYYLDQLKKAGWTNTVKIKPDARNPSASLVFTSGGRQLFISLTPNGGVLKVTVQEMK